jgi:glycosyltransferase involved in cell wall biosynthesis
MTPKVSIIMATYNRAHFIVETLLSIQKQTFNDWECIIIDDGGTDNTLEIIEPILLSDKRFKFYNRIDKYQKGLPGCRNFGLDLANGDYIIFFDDDDIVHPQNLELCVKELYANDIYFCRYNRETFINSFTYSFDFSDEYSHFYIDVNDIENLLKHNLPFNSCAIMWKKECFENNRFIENLMYAEEWELYSRILSFGFKGISINKTLFFGRKHINSNTGEFYSNNPIRRKSKSDAILLVLKNLSSRKLLTKSLLSYLIKYSFTFKEFNLFDDIIQNISLTELEKMRWRLFYCLFPIQFFIYRIKKKYF